MRLSFEACKIDWRIRHSHYLQANSKKFKVRYSLPLEKKYEAKFLSNLILKLFQILHDTIQVRLNQIKENNVYIRALKIVITLQIPKLILPKWKNIASLNLWYVLINSNALFWFYANVHVSFLQLETLYKASYIVYDNSDIVDVCVWCTILFSFHFFTQYIKYYF